jgi:hypothetical protein
MSETSREGAGPASTVAATGVSAPDELTRALRALAEDDAGRVSPKVEAAILAEFRSLYRPKRPLEGAGMRIPPARVFGYAVAATLVAAICGALWTVGRTPVANDADAGAVSALAARQQIEVATAFLPLTYYAVPAADSRVVRLNVSRAALGAFGLAPAESAAVPGGDTVLADVVVGEDGLARSVRFVRASRARGAAQ